ncbi:MAG: site-specific integrase, partial [Planctomycetes bacterium]|nr:site-specific integrase [Planctomycetota bacterium]
MRWTDIDKTPIEIDDVICWTYRVPEAKTAHHGHETDYALCPTAQAILGEFGGEGEEHVFTPRQAMQDRHDALRDKRQTPPSKQMRERDQRQGRSFRTSYTVDNYAQAVDRALQRTSVRRFTPHEIRHGYLTRAARSFGVIAASAAANHMNIATTQRYLHADREDAYRVAVGLERPEAPVDAHRAVSLRGGQTANDAVSNRASN